MKLKSVDDLLSAISELVDRQRRIETRLSVFMAWSGMPDPTKDLKENLRLDKLKKEV